jgi:2'-5' RNA ligase
VRLFVAVLPPAVVLADLERALPVDLPGGPRWVDPARWHVTLAFLGEVAGERLGTLCAALGSVTDRLPAAAGPTGAGPDRGGARGGAQAAGSPYGLRLAGAGTFPSRGRPGVLWVGLESTVDGAVDRLAAAARAVARAARGAGVAVERRPFRAHLTVGRWRPGDPVDRGVLDALSGYRGPAFELGRYVLVRSVLGPSPGYETLAGWPLGG